MSEPGKASVERLVKELYGLGVVRREIARHALAELGTQGFNALAVVHVYGPMRVSDAAQKLSVDLSVASRQVNALVKAGYLERESDPAEGRGSVVRPTSPGPQAPAGPHRPMGHASQAALGARRSAHVPPIPDGLPRLNADFADAPAHVEE